jgi:hypothetical protein
VHYFPAVRVHESTVDSLSRGAAKRPSSHGGVCGERIELVKGAIRRSKERPSQTTCYGTGSAGTSKARVLDKIDSASPIMAP